MKVFQTEAFYERAQSRLCAQGAVRLDELKKGVSKMALRQPSWAAELIKKAEREYAGEQMLPGTGAAFLYVGIPPKWKEQPVTDKEYLWSLNRMYHWIDFLIAGCLTENNQYAERIKEELTDWIAKCPPPPVSFDLKEAEMSFNGVTPWRTLEAGIRMFEVWPLIIHFLAGEGLLDRETLKITAQSFYEHGVVLRSIPPMLWPEADHNHYLMENLGLFYISHLFPEFDTSPDWSVYANEQIIRCAMVQISEDGAQIEGCPTYHNLCMHFFCLWLILCEESDTEVPAKVKGMIQKGLDYSMASFRPQGGGVPWGDSDVDYGAVKAAVLGYRAFHDAKWLVCLEEMLGVDRLVRECTACVPETGGIDIPKVIKMAGFQSLTRDLPRCSFQRQISQASFRTSWRPDAFHIQFGCRMPGKNGHAHIDPLSFDFSALGKAILVDPGRFTYDEANDRALFKSAEMHNSLMVDHCPPYEYVSSWKFGTQHDGCLLKAEEENGSFWAHGIHTCYFPMIHQRVVSVIKGKFLLIWDRVEHMIGSHTVSLYFHMDETALEPGDEPGSFVTRCEAGVNTYIRSLSSLPSQMMPGFVSEQIDVRHPSVRICYEDVHATGRKDYLTIVVPFAGNQPEVKHDGPYEDGRDTCVEICVDGTRFCLRWDGGEVWKVEEA